MSRLRAVLFDLDDTLYPECQYVDSGFAAVARRLARRGIPTAEALRLMRVYSLSSPGHVFDELARTVCRTRSPITSTCPHSATRESVLALQMTRWYRCHTPKVHLYPDVEPALRELRRRGYRLGLVTDGVSYVQRNKVRALGVSRYLNVIVYTDRLAPDRACWKPSSVPFRIALERLHVSPEEVAYVADNPEKDFTGPLALGMEVWHITRPDAVRAGSRDPGAALPDRVVRGLCELLAQL